MDKSLNIGAAVSGGADSMVLLELLLKTGARVAVVNVDHSIRGEASAQDSAFVKGYCNQKGLPFFFKKVDAPGYAYKHGLSVELAARELRYAFFDELIRDGKVDAIALAHHMDDQTETIIMRFLRGTGVRGLRGITDRAGYIHPLLDYDKEEILAFAKERAIPYVQDDTNFDTNYRRNFLRQEVLPLLKTKYPEVNKVVRKNGLIFSELEDYLISEITPCRQDAQGVVLPASLLDRHPAIAKKSIAEALRTMGVSKDIEYPHLNGILELKYSQNNARLNLPFGIDVIKEYDALRFVLRREGGGFEMPYKEGERYEYCGRVYSFEKGEGIIKGASFDADKLPAGATVRTRRSGDSFKRYKGGQKSLSDYLTDIKLPASEREKLLVLATGSTVYAVLGIEVADEVKIDKDTKNIIKIVAYKGVN